MNLAELPLDERARRFRDGGLAWDVGPFRVRVRTGLDEVGRNLARLYAAFPVRDASNVADVDVVVDTVDLRRRRVTIWVDGEPVYERIPRGVVVPMLEWTLNVTVFQRPHRFFLLHAAVVERDGRALVLPGRAGSGKSTLCAVLAHSGWRLLSDEVAVFRPEDGQVLPVPRPISLKEASIRLIRRTVPHARFGPSWPGTSKGTVAHVVPPESAVRRSGDPARPSWIVFPAFERGAGARIAPLSKARSLMRCAENAFNYSVLGATAFETLANAVDRSRCATLAFGDLDRASALLDGLDGGGA